MIQVVADPAMDDLQEFRLPQENHNAFQTRVLDFKGPFSGKEYGKNFSRYLLLFTSSIVRAVYLEVAVDLTTDSTIICIHRFISFLNYRFLDHTTLCNPALQPFAFGFTIRWQW